MSIPESVTTDRPRFTWMEFSGALGDLGLFIPLVVGVSLACHLDLGVVLIMAGVMNVITGFLFRQPIPVQPMKAIAAVAITEGMLKGELIAAGLGMGFLLFFLSFFTDKVSRFVPKALVRGIQLGVGIKLALKGCQWMAGLPWVGINSLLGAVFITVFLLWMINKPKPALVFVFLFGFAIQYLLSPEVFSTVTLSPPHFQIAWPTPELWGKGLLKGTLPQLPLTLLNSVLAVCALSADYFPGRGIPPRKMALSVGLMNLVAVPLGGIPMCHGAGGLAAQYRFGARTGGSVIMLGMLKIVIGLIWGSVILSLLKTYPLSVLGPMLVFAGVELAKASRDIWGQTRDLTVGVVTAVVIIFGNTLWGFLAGAGAYMAICLLFKWHKGEQKKKL